ncbi:hypothetical protein EVAR_47938_1 [Eumeta japonica]|uniref:Uncharacterized protein n=1 Tax=Eumeta variegata TaxID=151549 RepID=A0A4C1Y7Z5_EUMVA|nr:hypothetical protein EVAR_47938_1 [Eumeta japonica]
MLRGVEGHVQLFIAFSRVRRVASHERVNGYRHPWIIATQEESPVRRRPIGYWRCQRIPPRASSTGSLGKFLYRGIGSSKLDCGDEVHHPSHLVPRRGETRTEEFRFGTLDVCVDDRIDDICEFMKDRRVYILCE